MEIDLKNINWKPHKLKDIFTFENGICGSIKDIKSNNKKIDFVGATSKNNGNVAFVDSKFDKFAVEGNCIVFIRTGEGSVGEAIYKQNKFIPSKNVSLGRSEHLNRFVGNFFVTLINNQSNKYNYGYVRSDERLKNETLLLPTTSEGIPDYLLMEAFMRKKEKLLICNYKNYIRKRFEKLENETPMNDSGQKEWKEFCINDIFKIKSGKRLTKKSMKTGNMPFIGSSDSNNGITAFISNSNPSIDSNVLGVNYNGSVVENFYHPYKAAFSDDVKRLSLKEIKGNRYVYLFVKTTILMQKDKYQYGYKFNETRMNKQKILLPIDDNQRPDYQYMENYMKRIEYIKILKYLERKKQI